MAVQTPDLIARLTGHKKNDDHQVMRVQNGCRSVSALTSFDKSVHMTKQNE